MFCIHTYSIHCPHPCVCVCVCVRERERAHLEAVWG
jgi:hypothetical protein